MVKVLLIDEDRGRGALIAQALRDSESEFHILRPDASENLIKLVESFLPDVIIIEVDSPSRDTLEHLAFSINFRSASLCFVCVNSSLSA